MKERIGREFRVMNAEEIAERLGFSVGPVLVRVELSFSFEVECEKRTLMSIIFR